MTTQDLIAAELPGLIEFAERIVGNRALAEDLAQDAILRALEKSNTVDTSKPIGPWLRGILRYKWLDEKYRFSCYVARLERVSIEQVNEIEQPSLEVEELKAIMLREVRALPCRERSVVTETYLNERTVMSAAQSAGISLITAKRARRTGFAKVAAAVRTAA
jgi:RNA polymerase sigma-70 factor (ECF subfamily)